jgi:uncharacterized Zn finger protein
VSERVRWSGQFLGMLESLRMGAQFQRGRRYARAGHVQRLTISSSLVVAQVQGSDEQIYRTRIAVRAFSAGQWGRVERILAAQALYVAKLLAGQVPDDIDRVFREQGLDLFPGRIDEIAMDCSCTDWDVPCRHLVAACYVLAESFDTDPFGIFAWRGRGREELLGNLRELRGTTPASSGPATGSGAPPGAGTPALATRSTPGADEPAAGVTAAARASTAGGSSWADELTADTTDAAHAEHAGGWTLSAGQPLTSVAVDAFWRAGDLSGQDAADWTVPAVPGLAHRSDALLDTLDPLPVRLGDQAITELLRPAYLALREPDLR